MSASPAPSRTANMSNTFPQLDELTTSRLAIENGMALAPAAPGIGVEWDFDAVKAKSVAEFTRTIGGTR